MTYCIQELWSNSLYLKDTSIGSSQSVSIGTCRLSFCPGAFIYLFLLLLTQVYSVRIDLTEQNLGIHFSTLTGLYTVSVSIVMNFDWRQLVKYKESKFWILNFDFYSIHIMQLYVGQRQEIFLAPGAFTFLGKRWICWWMLYAFVWNWSITLCETLFSISHLFFPKI